MESTTRGALDMFESGDRETRGRRLRGRLRRTVAAGLASAVVLLSTVQPAPLLAYSASSTDYSLKDSRETGGPLYAWEDILATGTAVPFPSKIDATTSVPIGFKFPFYGSLQEIAGVSTKAYITFGSTIVNYTNTNLPSSTLPNNLIAAFWDDLVVPTDGKVVYKTLGAAPNRRFIVTWDSVSRFYTLSDPTGSKTRFTLQAILYENGGIKMQYKKLTNGDGTNLGGTVSYVGGVSEAPTDILSNGDYKWRARAHTEMGVTSDWVEFNTATSTHFRIGKGLIDETRDNDNGDGNPMQTCNGGVLVLGPGGWLALAAALAGLLAARRRR